MPSEPSEFRDAAKRGVFPFERKTFGHSASGVPLEYVPSSEDTRLLVLAAIHGEEPETTFLLSRALRLLPKPPRHVACILSMNPDGLLLGTRGNLHGVDLNRNFPTADWTPGKTFSRLTLESPRVTELSTGTSPASEPETRALLSLVQTLKVQKMVALHAPFGWVDSDARTELSASLEKVFDLTWNCGAGYATPGSLGTFAAERGLECVTVELPREAPEILHACYAEPFARFLRDFE